MTAFHIPFLPPEALGDEGAIRAAAERAISLAKRGESRAALALALHARRNAQLLEMQGGESEALNAAAIVHLIRNDPVAAVATAIDACRLARRTGEASQLGHAQVSLYMSASILGACDDALERLEILAAQAACDHAPGVEIRARIAAGIIHGDHSRFDAARRQFERAMMLACRHPGPTGPSRIAANMANLHRKRALADFAEGYEAKALHECMEAVRLAGEACVLATQEGAVATEIDALAILGCVHELRGEHLRARTYLRESVALGHWARCPSSILWVLCELGRLCLDLDELDGASAAYLEAFRIAQEVRPPRKIVVACRGLAKVHARHGEPEAAAEWSARAEDEATFFEAATAQTRRQLRDFLAVSP